AEIAVLGGHRIALMHELVDAGVDPGSLEEWARHLGEGYGAGGGAAQANLEGAVAGEVGVDEHLVSRLHPVEPLRPHPAAAGDGDLNAREGGAHELAGDLLGGEAGVDDEAVAGETGGDGPAQGHLVADAAVHEHIEPLDAGALERAGEL